MIRDQAKGRRSAKTVAAARRAVRVGVCGLWLAGCAATAPPPPAKQATPAAASPANSPSRADLLAADITALDAILQAGWKAAGVAPAGISDDGEFLRRLTLDLIGRVPTLDEVAQFSANRSPNKRAAAVDRLLADPGFGEHLADLEGDLLFGSQHDRRYTSTDPRGFLAAAFNENRPYDQLAQALLTATGSEAQDGAAAFVITRERAGGGAEAVTGAASRIFLGMQIQCAQCHDHPYDPRWKQRDFYGLVGYFARTRVRRVRDTAPAAMASASVDNAANATMTTDMAPETMASEAMPAAPMPEGMPRKRPRLYEVLDLPRGEAKMHAPGATKDVPVPPKFLGRKLEPRPGETRRQTFARAVVASDLFAKAFVGRVWRQFFGAAPREPWDDLGGEDEADHPLLLT
ncbi:MAG TPA: DUF1549 domain-containing protein, partial [Polyangia bacterium]